MKQEDIRISLKKISYTYPGHPEPVLNSVSMDLGQKKTAIIGPNGSGKTTLLMIIMGLLKPDTGQILLNDQPVHNEADLKNLRAKVGYVFQDPNDQLFCPTVIEDIAFGPLNQGLDAVQAKNRALQAMHDLGLQGFEERLTHKLSGGEKRLVALATILAMRPAFLFLDEPTNDLAMEPRARLTKILKGLDIPYAVISHDWDFLYHVAHEYVELQNGRLTSTSGGHMHTHAHFHPAGHLPHTHQPD